MVEVTLLPAGAGSTLAEASPTGLGAFVQFMRELTATLNAGRDLINSGKEIIQPIIQQRINAQQTQQTQQLPQPPQPPPSPTAPAHPNAPPPQLTTPPQQPGPQLDASAFMNWIMTEKGAKTTIWALTKLQSFAGDLTLSQIIDYLKMAGFLLNPQGVQALVSGLENIKQAIGDKPLSFLIKTLQESLPKDTATAPAAPAQASESNKRKRTKKQAPEAKKDGN